MSSVTGCCGGRQAGRSPPGHAAVRQQRHKARRKSRGVQSFGSTPAAPAARTTSELETLRREPRSWSHLDEVAELAGRVRRSIVIRDAAIRQEVAMANDVFLLPPITISCSREHSEP